MSAEVRQAYDLRFLNVGEPARTPFRHLGVKGSQVQILSARLLFGLVGGTLVTK